MFCFQKYKMSFNHRRQFNNNDQQNSFGRQNNFGRTNQQRWQNNPPPIQPRFQDNFDLLTNLGLGNFQNFDRPGNLNYPPQNLNHQGRNNNNFRNENRSLSSDSIRFSHNQFNNFDRNNAPLQKRHRTESFNPPQRNNFNNFNRSQAPQRNPVPQHNNGFRDNSFAKFRNLEEFKDYRKNLKIRKSIEENEHNEGERNTDFIFISPADVKELRDDIYIAVRNFYLLLHQICYSLQLYFIDFT